jgi:hypothetical protein
LAKLVNDTGNNQACRQQKRDGLPLQQFLHSLIDVADFLLVENHHHHHHGE